jgi:predicted LPLAT superfamily acyltransferase
MNSRPNRSAASRRLPDYQWTSRPERGSLFMLRLMTWISLRLGRRLGRVILHLIAAYFLIFSGESRAASRAYLRRALAREPTLLDLYKHIFAFASTVHDRVYFINNRYDLFDITVHNEKIIHDVLADGRGAFLLGAHLGSFEAIHAMSRRQPELRTAMVMFEENARKINAMLTAINPAMRQDIIALGRVDTMLNVRERLNEGGVVSMLADRTLRDDLTLQAPLLGDCVAFPVGPFRAAALLRRPVIFMVGLYLGGNRYSIQFERLADFSAISAAERDTAIREAINRYASLLERYCRSAPYNWFNFFDVWRQHSPH